MDLAVLNKLIDWFSLNRKTLLAPSSLWGLSEYTLRTSHFCSGGIYYGVLPYDVNEVVVIGDLHGDYESLDRIISKFFSHRRIFVFCGDYLDRGARQLDVLIRVAKLKLLYPERVVLLKGNHELDNVNKCYDFYDSVPESVYQVCSKLVSMFDIFAIALRGKIFFVHGGIPKVDKDKYSISSLFREELEEDYLWNDPSYFSIWKKNPRGKGWLFPKFALENFCSCGFNLVIRGHQVRLNIEEAQKEANFFSERLWTVFSTGGKSIDSAYKYVTEPYVLCIKNGKVSHLSPIFGG